MIKGDPDSLVGPKRVSSCLDSGEWNPEFSMPDNVFLMLAAGDESEKEHSSLVLDCGIHRNPSGL